MRKRKKLRILHIAVINAGFPSDFCRMHTRYGDYARMVTFYRNKMGFPEDICMDFKLPKGKFVDWWREKKQQEAEQQACRQSLYFRPKNALEKFYFDITDMLRTSRIEKVIEDNELDKFEIIHYDSGLDFYRNSQQAQRWKKMGKKIVCCYYGSDLRIRGVIREMEELSDLNITGEYDHLSLKPGLEFMFFPYDTSELPPKAVNKSDRLKVVHSPTNRQFKGTDNILKVVEKLKREREFEFILLENRPRSEVLDIKSSCDIGIECVGGFMGGYGYGKSGLEMLGLEMPVITSMTEEYAQWLPENPFIIANNEQQLYEKLLFLLDNPLETTAIGRKGKQWVDKYHGFEAVNERLYELYEKYGII